MDEKRKPGETAHEMGLRLSVLQKTLELVTGAFSLVAALAWNDAIQTLFTTIFGQNHGLLAKFLYALLVTAILVWIGIRLSRITKVIEKKSNV